MIWLVYHKSNIFTILFIQNNCDYFNNFFDLKYALEDILGREVDLLEEHAISNHYLKENIEQTKALIYG